MAELPFILALGFSHLGAIARAYRQRVEAGSPGFDLRVMNFNIDEQYRPFFSVGPDKGIYYNDALIRDLKSAIADRKPALIIASLWSNEHFVLSTFNDPRPFDFVLPQEPDRPLSETAEIVSYDLFFQFMRERCGPRYGLGPLIKTWSDVPVCMISAPPPIEDLSQIPGGSPNEAVSAKVKELGIAPPELRYKVWKSCESIFAQPSERDLIRFVRVPPESVDLRGSRRREYFATDWIHASDNYGELVLRQVDQLIVAKECAHVEPSI